VTGALRRLLALAALGAPLLFGTAGAAERPSLWLEMGAYEGGTGDLFLQVDAPVAEADVVTLAAGRTLGGSGEPETETYVAAFAHGTDKPVYGAVRYTFWGERDALTTHTVSATLSARGTHGSVRITPSLRSIVLRTKAALPKKRLGTNAYGLGGSATLYLGRRVDLAGGGTFYSFEDDPAVLATATATRVFTTNALALSSGLLERNLWLELAVYVADLRLAVERAQSIYASDGNRSDIRAAKVDWRLSETYSLGVEVGAVDDSLADSARYGRFILGYRF